MCPDGRELYQLEDGDLLTLILILVGPVINKDGMKSGLSSVTNVNRAGNSEPSIKMMAWGPVYPVMPGERILYVDRTVRRMIKGQQGQEDLLNLPLHKQ